MCAFPDFGSAARPPGWAEMRTFDSLGQLLDTGIRAFPRERGSEGARYFFRGECAFFSSPQPGIFRNEKFIRNEHRIFQDALNRVPAIFAHCPTTFDKLCQAQHYEFPTRLLDVSSDLVSAWFMAVDGWTETAVVSAAAGRTANGSFFCPNVLVFRVPEKRVKFSDSDLVAALSAIARMDTRFDLWKLRHEVRQERNFFGENEVFMKRHARLEWCCNWLVHPRMSNPRVARQKGAFILCGLTHENSERLAAGLEADKEEKNSAGLHFPAFPWDPQRRSKEEISLCGRLVPSREYFREVSDAVRGGVQSFRDAERIHEAVGNFRRKVFDELSFAGCGESEMYSDNLKRHAEACRAFFGG